MRPSPLLLLLALLSLPFGGCVVLENPEWTDDDDDDATDDDDDDDATAAPCSDPDDPQNWLVDEPDQWDVAASFITPDGEDAKNLMITLCGASCYNEPTNCEGLVYFPFADSDIYVIEPLFAPNLEFDRWARSFDFVDYDATTDRLDLTATPYTLPLVEEIEPFGPNEVERIFSSGLEVRFDGEAVELPFGPKVGTIGAVEIPEANYPTGGLLGWTPMRVWALAVWDMEIEEAEGFQVVAPLTTEVPDGAEVTFLVAHYEYGIVEGTFEVFAAEVAGDRMSITTPPNAGIDRATMWIAAMRMP